ncbi:MAG: dehypoxanthine futalosine cyclase [Bacteroidetes bacterium]|nr:dehypoxanthine futalosine cyclase [Bacteroidota bacterium]
MPDNLYTKAIARDFLSLDEGVALYERAPLSDLMAIGNELRKNLHPGNKVGWIIDRNVNITNVCISRCRFCNFHRKPGDKSAYITTLEEYKKKIEELFALGGNQLLLQGGCHPALALDFYTKLFRDLKKEYPGLRLHALGPPEIVHLSKLEKKPVQYILQELIKAGLDSLPGAGAEILSDRVRKIISPAKCSSSEWLEVMREAHKMGMIASATMMFGHVETPRERIAHLIAIRELQAERPAGTKGFISFIPWPFRDKGTLLRDKNGIIATNSPDEYIRIIAVSRIMLPNVQNLQASWLTVGKDVAQVCLYAGANDFGSIMIEENVVSSAGAAHKMDAEGIQKAIGEAGFEPRQRNQCFEYVS